MRKLLSARETLIYRKLCDAAEAGLPCPSNRELAGERGSSPASGLSMILAIEAKGYIVIHRHGHTRRRVEILESGKFTAWANRSYTTNVVRPALTDDEITDAREAAERRHREREDYWLSKEAETYGLPRKGLPISGMAA